MQEERQIFYFEQTNERRVRNMAGLNPRTTTKSMWYVRELACPNHKEDITYLNWCQISAGWASPSLTIAMFSNGHFLVLMRTVRVPMCWICADSGGSYDSLTICWNKSTKQVLTRVPNRQSHASTCPLFSRKWKPLQACLTLEHYAELRLPSARTSMWWRFCAFL